MYTLTNEGGLSPREPVDRMEPGISVASDEAARPVVAPCHRRAMSENLERELLCACGARKRKAPYFGCEGMRGGNRHSPSPLGPRNGFSRDWRHMVGMDKDAKPSHGFGADARGLAVWPLWRPSLGSPRDAGYSSISASSDSHCFSSEHQEGPSSSSVSNSQVQRLSQMLWSAGSVGSVDSLVGAIRTQEALDPSRSVEEECGSSTLSAQDPWLPDVEHSEGCRVASPTDDSKVCVPPVPTEGANCSHAASQVNGCQGCHATSSTDAFEGSSANMPVDANECSHTVSECCEGCLADSPVDGCKGSQTSSVGDGSEGCRAASLIDCAEGIQAALLVQDNGSKEELERMPSIVLGSGSCEAEPEKLQLWTPGGHPDNVRWEPWMAEEDTPTTRYASATSKEGLQENDETKSSVVLDSGSCELEPDNLKLWMSGDVPLRLAWESWVSDGDTVGTCSVSLTSRSGRGRGLVCEDDDQREVDSDELWTAPRPSDSSSKVQDVTGGGTNKEELQNDVPKVCESPLGSVDSVELWTAPLQSDSCQADVVARWGINNEVLQEVETECKEPHALFRLGEGSEQESQFQLEVGSAQAQNDGQQGEVLSGKDQPKTFMVSILDSGVCDEDVDFEAMHMGSVGMETEPAGQCLLLEEQEVGVRRQGNFNNGVAGKGSLTVAGHHRSNTKPWAGRDSSEDSPGSLAGNHQVGHFGRIKCRGLMMGEVSESRPDWEEANEGEEIEEPLTARGLVTSGSFSAEAQGARGGRMSLWENIDLTDPSFCSESDNVESRGSSVDGLEDRAVMASHRSPGSTFLGKASGDADAEVSIGMSDDSDGYQTAQSHQSESCSHRYGYPGDRASAHVGSTSWEQLQEATAAPNTMKVTRGNPRERTEVDCYIYEDDTDHGSQSPMTNASVTPVSTAPHHHRSSTGSTSWERMDDDLMLSGGTVRMDDTLMLSGGTVRGLSSDSSQDDDQRTPVWSVGSRELATLDARSPPWGETCEPEMADITEVCGGFTMSHRGDPLESLLDCPSAVGHKRLQTVLEESVMSEDMLSDDHQTCGDSSSKELDEGVVPGVTPQGLQDQGQEERSPQRKEETALRRFFCPDFIRCRTARSRSDSVASGTRSALDGQAVDLQATLLDVEDRCKSAPCKVSGVFDGFFSIDSEVSEFFVQPASALDGEAAPSDRPDSRQSDPSARGSKEQKHETSSESASPSILRWLRSKLTLRSSPTSSSEGTLIGSVSEQQSTMERKSSSFRTASDKGSDATSSISLSDMPALSSQGVGGPEMYDVVLNSDIYESNPIEYGPEGPIQLYSMMRPRLRSLGVNVDKWDALSGQPVPVIDFFDCILEEADNMGIDLFSIMEETAGQDHSLVIAIREALYRAPLSEDGDKNSSNKFEKEDDRGSEQWQIEVESKNGAPTNGSGEQEDLGVGRYSMDVLDALSECGINAMFFDRDMSQFGSEAEYYCHMADCLKSEGVTLTPALVERLGETHPLSMAMVSEQSVALLK
eukprot:evm.model.scf_2458.1 EVM.evm.TU.scf_2458.1   scf_2458:7101-11808(+)